jgi:hypothetical protein
MDAEPTALEFSFSLWSLLDNEKEKNQTGKNKKKKLFLDFQPPAAASAPPPPPPLHLLSRSMRKKASTNQTDRRIQI